jgi:hypothetical protein
MTDTVSRSHWAGLRADRPQGGDDLATQSVVVDEQETLLRIGMNQGGRLHLLIPVSTGPDDSLPPDLNGLRVRHQNLDIGGMLVLSAPPSHEQVFTPFCSEIVHAVVRDKRDPWKSVATTIRAWQSAWKPVQQGIDKITQVGLFGELLVLRYVMIPALGAASVYLWSGPDSERHDFVGDVLHLEVKTTRKSRSEHEISRIDQLRITAGCQLLFVSVQVEESIGGEESIATQMDAVVDLLRSDAAALDEFMAKMVRMGWSDEMADSGELLRFNITKAEFYIVDDEFPRLPDGFSPPSGVVSIKYTIDLANLPSLGVDEAIDIVRGTNGAHDV